MQHQPLARTRGRLKPESASARSRPLFREGTSPSPSSRRGSARSSSPSRWVTISIYRRTCRVCRTSSARVPQRSCAWNSRRDRSQRLRDFFPSSNACRATLRRVRAGGLSAGSSRAIARARRSLAEVTVLAKGAARECDARGGLPRFKNNDEFFNSNFRFQDDRSNDKPRSSRRRFHRHDGSNFSIKRPV